MRSQVSCRRIQRRSLPHYSFMSPAIPSQVRPPVLVQYSTFFLKVVPSLEPTEPTVYISLAPEHVVLILVSTVTMGPETMQHVTLGEAAQGWLFTLKQHRCLGGFWWLSMGEATGTEHGRN